MHIHGANGLRAGVDEKTGKLLLYWGESRIFGDVTSAVRDCLKSLAPMLQDHEASKRDLQLLQRHLDVDNKELEDAPKRFLNPDDPASKLLAFRGLCLVGFECAAYPPMGPSRAEISTIVSGIGLSRTSTIAVSEHHNLGPAPRGGRGPVRSPLRGGEGRKWSNRAGPHVGWHNSSFEKGMSPRPARPSEGKGLPPIPAHQPRAHNPQKIPAPNPMTSPDLSDPERAAPEEPGVSVEAMEVGVQFLRDATEQYNFESQVKPEADHEDPGAPVGQLISEATLESANQADVPLPVSDALLDEQPEVLGEPEELDVDLTSDAIRAASLFDQPLNELAADEEEEAEDELDVTLAGPLRQPAIATDDPSEVDDAKLEAIQRAFDERVKKRLHVERLPSTREDEEAKP